MNTNNQCIVKTVKKLSEEMTKNQDILLKTRICEIDTNEKQSIYATATPDWGNIL